MAEPAAAVIARRIRLRDLHTLQVVADCGSMARAAEALALSQPAISKAVTEMERALGVPLLERSARGVVPTACGQALLSRGTAMLDELRRGIEEIRFLADPTTGEVRIGATEPMTAVVSAAIDRLTRRYPRMTFRVDVSDTGMLYRWLRERSIDIAVTRTAGPDAPEPDLAIEPLFEDPLVVMVGRRNPLLRRRRLDLATLHAEEAWTLPPPETFIGRMVMEAFRLRGLGRPPRVVVTRTVQARVALLRAGRFLDILPSAMLRFPGHYPGLAALPIPLPETRRPIALVSLAHRMPTPATRLFAEAAREVVR